MVTGLKVPGGVVVEMRRFRLLGGALVFVQINLKIFEVFRRLTCPAEEAAGAAAACLLVAVVLVLSSRLETVPWLAAAGRAAAAWADVSAEELGPACSSVIRTGELSCVLAEGPAFSIGSVSLMFQVGN